MIEFIEINGSQHPITINFYVIGLFQQETGKSFTSLVDIDNNLYLVEPLLYHALRVGYGLNKQEFPFTRDDMVVLLSDNEVYRRFTEVMTKFFPAPGKKDDTKKKKA